MSAIFTAALLLATVPQDAVLRDRCCCLEINVFCDDEAHEVFTQLLAWELCDGRERIVDWRMVKRSGDGRLNVEVQRDYARGGYVATWFDSDKLRELRAPCYRERWTQYDPEVTNCEHWPKERRRLLSSGTCQD